MGMNKHLLRGVESDNSFGFLTAFILFSDLWAVNSYLNWYQTYNLFCLVFDFCFHLLLFFAFRFFVFCSLFLIFPSSYLYPLDIRDGRKAVFIETITWGRKCLTWLTFFFPWREDPSCVSVCEYVYVYWSVCVCVCVCVCVRACV